MRKLQSSITLFKQRAFRTIDITEHLGRSASADVTRLSKALDLADLTFLGLGSIVGAGVYVLSGVVAQQVAGPAVVLSYLVAASAALLSALCYAEFAVDLPVAGGAFNYILVTFGEFPAWSVAWNMVLETLLSSSAVARGFSSYVATLFGLQPDYFLLNIGSTAIQLDPLALVLILVLTAILAVGTKESSRFNMMICIINLCCILFVLATGLPHADNDNIKSGSIAPYGSRGVFQGASIVFFSFIGFDYLANAAEESVNPSRDLPLSIIASLSIATILYVLMSITIVWMIPYQSIDINAPFSAAFVAIGMNWVAKIVSIGALMGIIASTMTGLLSQARLFLVLGRQNLLPSRLSHVHPRTETPLIATLVTGGAAGLLALVLDIHVLAELVSVGTLYVFYTVCAGVLYRRYHNDDTTTNLPVLIRLGILTASAIALSASYTFQAPWPVLVVWAVIWILVTASLYTIPRVYFPLKFCVPLFPLTPALGILFTVHLICSLGWLAYVRFAVWNLAGFCIYAFYSVHQAEENEPARKRRRQAAGVGDSASYTGSIDTSIELTAAGLQEENTLTATTTTEHDRLLPT